ncbi:MAG TPA: N-acetylmuramoyl-L-alanine amidase [Dissulfurispiraceae bacterium]|nr:N-acetylmuramoyl-L-alanine amidase [Dissulfurispiraceae bacterium]
MTVKLRAARHQDSIRVVLVADDSLVQSSSVLLTKNKSIVIDLHPTAADGGEKPAISFETDKGPIAGDTPVEIMNSVTVVARETGCVVILPKIEEIKVMKLQSPSRLVIDAFFNPVPKDSTVAPPTLKPVSEQIPFRFIVVDAGHGGYDYGLRGTNYSEKDFVLQFSKEFAAAFGKGGREVQLTRKSDQIMSLAERISIANKKTPDLLISFHLASTQNPIIYNAPERQESEVETSLARNNDRKKTEMITSIIIAIAASMEKEFAIKPLREALPLSLLMKSRAPAILIELPNPDDFNYDKKNKERLISLILKGLSVAVKEEKPAVPPTAQKNELVPAEKTPDKTDKTEKM